MQVVLCIGGTMYMLYLWYWCTCGVADMRYYVCALFSCRIVTCVFIVLYYVYVYVLCCMPGVGVCIVCGVHRM